jgi:phage tail-like protein
MGKAPADATLVPNAKFLLEVDNITIMSFEKITIGDSEWGVIEGRTGTDELHKLTSSGLKTVTTFTVEKQLRDEGGADDVKEIINWHAAGSKDRRTGAVVFLDRDDNELIRLEFSHGWISKFTYPELDASQNNTPLAFIFDISVGTYKAS